jgi:BirA family biotin operon repressor/biotin-[acetyl-CoA-carboxylase] ligase
LDDLKTAMLSSRLSLIPGAIALPLQVEPIVDSTNRVAWDQLRDRQTETIVIAAEQRSGRGQWGRSWQSALGGVYLSLAVQLQCPLALATQLTLCSSWGIVQALRSLDIPAQIKWPNDVVLDGRKLAGILTETRSHQGAIAQAVIGVGLNWCNSVPDPGISLRSWLVDRNHPARDQLPDINHLTARIIWGLWGGYRAWQTHGMASLLPDYDQWLRHQQRWVQWGDRSVQVMGITPDGDLRVRQPTATGDRLWVLQPGDIRLGYDSDLGRRA